MTLRLYDTATRETRDFVPLEEGKAGIYLCGLTVQSEPHVGHVRSGVNFDVLRRWLTVSGYEVAFIRNFTDIDDKILIKSAAEGRPWYNLGYMMKRELDSAYDALHVLPATYEPAATGHIPEMIELIEELVRRGHAYPAEDGSGDVYFDVKSWPAYGELSGQKVDEMEAAADADPRGKRDPRDFALWKGFKKESEPETASWPAPWGRGRPGWHIECSAMASKYLGGAFDIHGGGVDLRFPHHENEQAQSRAAGHRFATYWMHNAWITTAGEKMSKSLGNSLFIPVVLEQVRAIELRFYMIAPHYRSHVEFSYEALAEAAAGFRRIEGYLDRATEIVGEVDATKGMLCADFVAAMDDDLSTPAAVAAIYEVVKEGNKLLGDANGDAHAGSGGGGGDGGGNGSALRGNVASVRAMLDVLGLDPLDPHWARGESSSEAKLSAAVDALVAAMLEQRADARERKDFAAADAIRDQLKAAGIELEDTPNGPRWTLG